MALVHTTHYSEQQFECKYEVEAPRVYYERLSSLLKECPSQQQREQTPSASGCAVCDERFFASLAAEVAAVTSYFNKRVQWLLHIHLASGLKKIVLKVQHKPVHDHAAMIRESQDLIMYASMMTLSAHALLEEYDKMHASHEGAHFKSQLVGQHKEFVQSPWLIELLALYFNLKNNDEHELLPELCSGWTCDVSNDKLTLACVLQDALKVEIEATCSICLETVFDPIALSCGHMFCYSCACSIASVHTYEKMEKTKVQVKCPLCRETSAFAGGMRLTELNMLIYRRCKDYWKTRRQRERKERMKEIKDQWSYEPKDIGTQRYFL